MKIHTAFATCLLGLSLSLSLTNHANAADSKFAWSETADDATDLTYNGKNIARYVHPTLDDSSKEAREATYKPFHHVYQTNGKDFLTKGAGGQFTHHRGIYYGFSKCKYTTPEGEEVVVDTWHCKPPAYQSHEKILAQTADDSSATQVLQIDWHGAEGKVFAHETRTVIFYRDAESLVVDFSSSLKPAEGIDKVTLDGDPQHAGFQFRASNEVNDKTKAETYYLRPGTGKDEPGKTINWSAKNDTKATRDLPWKAMSFVVGGLRYTTLYLDHPKNPKPARYSERDYGRFGSYFVAIATAKKPVEVHYRLHITQGEIDGEKAEVLSEPFVTSPAEK